MAEQVGRNTSWEQLDLPELTVGPQTVGFHKGDTTYWKSGKIIMYQNIYSVGRDGLLYFFNPRQTLSSGLLSLGTVVKIDCPHKK